MERRHFGHRRDASVVQSTESSREFVLSGWNRVSTMSEIQVPIHEIKICTFCLCCCETPVFCCMYRPRPSSSSSSSCSTTGSSALRVVVGPRGRRRAQPRAARLRGRELLPVSGPVDGRPARGADAARHDARHQRRRPKGRVGPRPRPHGPGALAGVGRRAAGGSGGAAAAVPARAEAVLPSRRLRQVDGNGVGPGVVPRPAPPGLEDLLGVAHGELEIVNASALEPFQPDQLVPDVSELGWEVLEPLVIRDHKAGHLGLSPALYSLRNELLDERVGDQPDDHADGNRQEAEDDGGPPHAWALASRTNAEGGSTEADDDVLPSTHNNADADEEPILQETLEYVEVVVQATIATSC